MGHGSGVVFCTTTVNVKADSATPLNEVVHGAAAGTCFVLAAGDYVLSAPIEVTQANIHMTAERMEDGTLCAKLVP
eukprot:1147224-Rhodomonas_salina.1